MALMKNSTKLNANTCQTILQNRSFKNIVSLIYQFALTPEPHKEPTENYKAFSHMNIKEKLSKERKKEKKYSQAKSKNISKRLSTMIK